ncbi:MAG: energy transducer TonB [Proteobacteria bacterium]|nr:MAG: energy transducer TonB [Pseudomonadota bacterium]
MSLRLFTGLSVVLHLSIYFWITTHSGGRSLSSKAQAAKPKVIKLRLFSSPAKYATSKVVEASPKAAAKPLHQKPLVPKEKTILVQKALVAQVSPPDSTDASNEPLEPSHSTQVEAGDTTNGDPAESPESLSIEPAMLAGALDPEYPQEARDNGIEGYVLIGFDLSASGKPQNVRIIESKPKGYFERAAKKAIGTRVYKPRVIDGVPAVYEGMKVRFNFSLSN